MNKQFLFPHKLKFVGCALFLSGIIFGVFADNAVWLNVDKFLTVFGTVGIGNGGWSFFQIQSVNLGFTIQSTLIIVGCLLVAFSKEKTEDEFINLLRLRSFQYSVLINFSVVLLCLLLIWGFNFVAVLMYNLYSTLIFFIIIFHILLWRNSKKEVEK